MTGSIKAERQALRGAADQRPSRLSAADVESIARRVAREELRRR